MEKYVKNPASSNYLWWGIILTLSSIILAVIMIIFHDSIVWNGFANKQLISVLPPALSIMTSLIFGIMILGVFLIFYTDSKTGASVYVDEMTEYFLNKLKKASTLEDYKAIKKEFEELAIDNDGNTYIAKAKFQKQRDLHRIINDHYFFCKKFCNNI